MVLGVKSISLFLFLNALSSRTSKWFNFQLPFVGNFKIEETYLSENGVYIMWG